MARFARIIAALWLLLQLVAAIPTPELQPLPRSLWDGSSAKTLVKSARAIDRVTAEKAVKPSEKEEFFWASTDSNVSQFLPSPCLC